MLFCLHFDILWSCHPIWFVRECLCVLCVCRTCYLCSVDKWRDGNVLTSSNSIPMQSKPTSKQTTANHFSWAKISTRFNIVVKGAKEWSVVVSNVCTKISPFHLIVFPKKEAIYRSPIILWYKHRKKHQMWYRLRWKKWALKVNRRTENVTVNCSLSNKSSLLFMRRLCNLYANHGSIDNNTAMRAKN